MNESAELKVANARIEELEETMRDIRDECKKARADDWVDRIDAIRYLANAALIEEG